MKSVAIVGIHTGIGKTVFSAIITQALKADYWKPVQAGNLDESDTLFIQRHIDNANTIIHPEAISLQEALSPHAAAVLENRTIDYKKFQFPKTTNLLIIETAGGLMSPINDTDTMLDFIRHYKLPVIVVSMNYLGSINHTLLTLQVLEQNHIAVVGLVFNGNSTPMSETFIKTYEPTLPVIGNIPFSEPLTKEFIVMQADQLQPSLQMVYEKIK